MQLDQSFWTNFDLLGAATCTKEAVNEQARAYKRRPTITETTTRQVRIRWPSVLVLVIVLKSDHLDVAAALPYYC